MMKLRKLFKILYLITFCAGTSLVAQERRIDSLVARGDSLHSEYSFVRALESYTLAMEEFRDSILTVEDSILKAGIEDKMLLSENGRNMTSFAYSPTVVAKHKFSLKDFFLYYPLQDKSWRSVPNQLDSLGGPFAKAVFAPEDTKSIYFSAKDGESIRNIYKTELQDTLWTVPALLNEQMTSEENEIYPMLSPDGKELYFASKGLYGVGGYDLYVSEWEEDLNDWSIPLNMGFPFSSPADDFLFINTEDGNYTIFASNRECQADSVWVYVLEFENMPVRKAVADPKELKALSMLDPQTEEDRINAKTGVAADIPENSDTERYMHKMAEVRALRDSISRYTLQLEEKRSKFALSSDEDERMQLTNEILANEAVIPQYQDSLDKAVAQLQKIEMEFLFKGVVIDPDKLLARADQEVVGEATTYTFSKRNLGGPLKLDFMAPEVKFDYSFKVLPEGCFAEDNTIPPGIVYQIQMFGASKPVGVKALRGLSPVFERKTASGKYVYRVGLFNTYKDVLSNLNAVKKVGFRTAFIVAYIDGNEVSVSKARTAEADVKNNPVFYEVTITYASGEMDPATAEEVRAYSDGKDIAKMSVPDGGTVYRIGPYTDKGKADQLVVFVKEMGVADVVCKVLGE